MLRTVIINLLIILVTCLNGQAQNINKCLVDVTSLTSDGKKEWDKNSNETEFGFPPNQMNSASNKKYIVKWYQFEKEANVDEVKEFKKHFKDNKTPFFINDTTCIRFGKIFKIKKQIIYANQLFVIRFNGFGSYTDLQRKQYDEEFFASRNLNPTSPNYFVRKTYTLKGDTILLQDGIYPTFNVDKTPYFTASGKTFQEKIGEVVTLTYNQNFKYGDSDFSILMFDENRQESFKYNYYKKGHLENINKLLSQLAGSDLSYMDKNKLQKINTTDSIIYNYTTFSLTFKNNGQRIDFKLNESDQNAYLRENNTKISDILYYNDCLKEQEKVFDEKKLPNDVIQNEKLKSDLLSVITKSISWKNYVVYKIILTDESEWENIKTNPYSAFIDYRVLFASAYVKNRTTGNCFLVKNIEFQQKNEPTKGFIHDIKVIGFPQEEFSVDFVKFPCDK